MDTNEHIERLTFVGQTATQAFDGFAGFRLNQSYKLRYTQLADGRVSIELDHAREGAGPLVVSKEEFGTWWVKK